MLKLSITSINIIHYKMQLSLLWYFIAFLASCIYRCVLHVRTEARMQLSKSLSGPQFVEMAMDNCSTLAIFICYFVLLRIVAFNGQSETELTLHICTGLFICHLSFPSRFCPRHSPIWPMIPPPDLFPFPYALVPSHLAITIPIFHHSGTLNAAWFLS